ncbi:LysE family translocator [Actinomycetota bacterium]
MTLTSALLSFAVVAGLMTITPGLDTALVLRSAINHGRRVGFATALGVGAGVLVWAVAAAVGVSALLTASELAFTALKVSGAAYMLWLGGRMLWRAVRGSGHATDPLDEDAAHQPADTARAWPAFRAGLLTNLLNPKIGAFYVALLPQFLPEGHSHLLVGVLLGLVHNLEGLVWFAAIILAAGAVRAWLARPTVQRVVDGLTGSVIIGFGLRLGLARH